MDNKLDELKEEYMNIPIPKELDDVVNKALLRKEKRKVRKSWIIVIAAAVILFISSINANPSFAQTMEKIPIVGDLIKLLTFVEYKVEEENFHADIKVPEIKNLENKSLQSALNEKYLKENEQLYKSFMDEMDKIKEKNGGNIGVDSDYEVIEENEQILTIRRTVVKTAASAEQTVQYDTVDKKHEVLITLPSLFKNNDYVKVISENIQEQMRNQMKKDQNKIYWVEGTELEIIADEAFKTISKDQNFYINKNGKLVISFNEYDVAPGYMGVVEFEIPTKVMEDQLVSNEYVK
ncbi:anti-sigma-V factor rsiV [Metabacillus fastidiosus]|uniref:anti-sigma-V factor rsiV n=1 Tax=Metabacillus fastidiosus TaxID=1458 RepID=UPI0008249120|nr:anti-sigma-V factor rsiV [Metabacillus fastidiosus]MED4460914.1 DUF3298 domain-containing protein [Metabacillus fastidiosus]